MNKKRTVDLIHGPILPSLLSFAFPILLSNIFQQLYNTADVLIVGRFLGQDSLAAVGATTAIFDLIIGFTLGVGNGMGIVIARYYGARNFTKIKEAVAATWILGALLSVVIMLLGFLGLYLDVSTWYYLNASNGDMKIGWFQVNGKWYYAYNSGALAVNTTVDGYSVNYNGEWVQ